MNRSVRIIKKNTCMEKLSFFLIRSSAYPISNSRLNRAAVRLISSAYLTVSKRMKNKGNILKAWIIDENAK